MGNGMRDRARRTRQKIDQRFAEIENQLLADTTLDWEKLRPQLNSSVEYDRLIAIVEECTKKNESIGQLANRLRSLGTEGAKLLERVKGLLLA